MYTIKTYLMAQTLEEAYSALQKNKSNVILGGCGWLKMTRKRFWTGIDLSGLGLDRIEQRDGWLEIGAMVTLRQLETDPALRGLFGGILPRSVERIVGVQFRSCATVGGSVWMRAGFSDLLTALSVLDTEVELYHAGRMPLEAFFALPRNREARDILTGIRIRLDGRDAACSSMRNTATDFPVVGAAVSRCGPGWSVAVGARPMRAVRVPEAEAALAAGDLQAASRAVEALGYAGNLRGSADYRRKVAQVLVRRAAEEILHREGKQ
ncbi:FAD binding domain-containing protein [Anaerotruncus sp. 1XD22-93]|uniref:FAD binding domain-containing protein n=1 Tax=Anaerotruncus sp. 1XD42-93 TaxID=2320853 RepID=UPI001FAA534B